MPKASQGWTCGFPRLRSRACLHVQVHPQWEKIHMLPTAAYYFIVGNTAAQRGRSFSSSPEQFWGSARAGIGIHPRPGPSADLHCLNV